MRNARTVFLFIFLIFFVIAVLGGLFWANLNLINPVPGGAEFIVPWKAMQNFMMSGVTPYGEFTALNIQNLIYNHSGCVYIAAPGALETELDLSFDFAFLQCFLAAYNHNAA